MRGYRLKDRKETIIAKEVREAEAALLSKKWHELDFDMEVLVERRAKAWKDKVEAEPLDEYLTIRARKSLIKDMLAAIDAEIDGWSMRPLLSRKE